TPRSCARPNGYSLLTICATPREASLPIARMLSSERLPPASGASNPPVLERENHSGWREHQRADASGNLFPLAAGLWPCALLHDYGSRSLSGRGSKACCFSAALQRRIDTLPPAMRE